MNQTTRPQRIQLSRKKGSKRPPGTVVCDRSSRWGNPHRVEPLRYGGRFTKPGGREAVYARRAQQAVLMYASDLRGGKLPFTVEDVRRELAGKNLGCWCALDSKHCHADVLLRVAAGGDP